MLVLTRKIGEVIYVDENISIKVVKINGNRVKLGIEAQDGMRIIRKEIEANCDSDIGNVG